MKKLITAVIASLALPAMAATQVDLQGTVFNVDTIQHFYVGPGMTQTHLTFTAGARTFQAYAVTLTRSEAGPNARVKVDIGRDSCQTAEAITSIARRKTTDSRQYLAGINGDFFITSGFSVNHEFGNAILGYPNVTCMTDGKIAAPDIIDYGSRENCFIVGTDGNMWIDATDLKYRLLNNDGSTVIDANAVNYPRRDNELTVYNSFAGKYTKTSGGRELTLRLAEDAEWAVNKSVKFVVEGAWADKGNSPIPSDGIVISMGPTYNGAGKEYLDGLKAGDVVKLKIVCALPAFDNLKPAVSEVCGGDVRILKENTVTTQAIRFINTPTAQYSRSMVGYSQDRDRVVLCSVDAGVSNSSGITYFEGADLMRALGCYDALDLDGGGSTAIWTHSHGIFNHLRDGSERAVGNGIFFVLDQPKDMAVTAIRFADHAMTMPRYGLYRPVIYGYNRYGQLVDTDVQGYELTAADAFGTVTDGGQALLATAGGTYALTAVKDGMTASIAVTVDDSTVPAPRVTDVLLDNVMEWPIELQASVHGSMMQVAPQAFDWTSDDVSVATVSADGVVRGVADGTAVLTGTLNGQTVSINVTVEIPVAQKMAVLGAIDPAEWTFSQSGCKNAVIEPLAAAGDFAVTFDVTSPRGPRVTVARETRLYSRPEALEFVLDSKENQVKTVTANIQSGASRPVGVTVDLGTAGETLVTVPLSEVTDITRIDAYPMVLKSLAFVPQAKANGVRYEVRGMRAVYSANAGGVDEIMPDGDGALNGATAPVMYYDLSGRPLRATGTLAPGLYLRRQGAHTAKVLVR